MMKLLLDVGNSAIKAGVATNDDNLIIRNIPIDGNDLHEAINKIIAETRPDEVFLASSNKNTNPKKLEYPSIQYIKSDSEFNELKNAYEDYKSLGSDRWLNLIYAWETLHDACCIIDCGTFITYDEINLEGEHLGGLILPGKRLSKDMMRQKLNNLSRSQGQIALGSNTADAIGYGSNMLFASIINGLVEYFAGKQEAQIRKKQVLITGGNAELAMQYVKFPAKKIDNMPLKGMLKIAGINH